jgi:hypothetical protein
MEEIRFRFPQQILLIVKKERTYGTMKRSVLFWIVAVLITLVSLVYQRVTGPSYPVSGRAPLGGTTIAFRLDRSYPGETNAPVEVRTDDQSVTGVLRWKRYKTDDPWTEVPMSFTDGVLKGELPHQPVAGKLLYNVELRKGEQRVSLPGPDPIVIRFRGDVPVWIIVPHVFAMFCAFLFSARAGLEYFSKEPKFRNFMYLTLGFLVLGGFILGPLMQYFSFNAWWTGWPIGSDLTDNKTAVAFLAWVVAAVALTRAKNPKRWALAASIIMIVVYLIPHSILGSEFDYGKMDKHPSQTESPR